MTSPMVDRVRDIPLFVESDYNNPDMVDSGFPFEGDFDNNDGHFRSQLDDLAQRHPEFAKHLEGFRTRGDRTRTPEPRTRFTDRPFGTRFERFGFPFDEEESFPQESQEQPYYQRYPRYYSQSQDSQEPPQAPPTQQSCSSSTNTPEQCEADTTQPDNAQDRGRKPKNIQQSNTADLTQKQEPVDERNQRSMSAPPDGRQRFTSSINIPVQAAGASSMGSTQSSQTTQSQQPTERVIPIHVEGRDEPVVPKSFAHQTSSQQQQQQPPRSQEQPQSDRFFGYRPSHFTQFLNRDHPRGFRGDWPPSDSFHAKPGVPPQQQPPQPQPSHQQQAHQQSHQQQAHQQPHQQPQPQQHPHPQQPEQKPAQAPSQEPPHQEPPKAQPASPIDQIKSIQKDVSELMKQVEQFSGKPKDKQYLYLDEMLTRNLIKLDNIDTQGQENIRQARKEAIKCIESCIGVLESKAQANAENEKMIEVVPAQEPQEQTEVAPETNEMEVEKPEEVNLEVVQPMEVEAVKSAADSTTGMEGEIKEGEGEIKEEESKRPEVIALPPPCTEAIALPAAEVEAPVTSDNKSEEVKSENSDKKEKKKIKKKAEKK